MWLLMVPALLLALPAWGADEGDSNKVAVNQIDLLGGITALVALTAALIQILPSPVQLSRGRLEQFLSWLRCSIASDFGVALYTCTGQCQTHTYEARAEPLRRRILASVGDVDCVWCAGANYVSVDELVRLVQTGSNAQTLLELAQLARYPEMAGLRRAIRTVYYSPTSGRSVIVVQWVGFLVCGMAYWLAVTGLPPKCRRLWRVVFNCASRLRGQLPRDHVGGAYRMAALARHRVVAQHIPWARFALYHMLVELAGYELSVRGCATDDDSDEALRGEPNEHLSVFAHPMLGERSLASRMATDECSATRLLYSNALHSMRVLLLSSAVGFAPPYLLTSSFRVVQCRQAATMLVMSHGSLDSVYRALFDDVTVHAAYDLLLKRLQSRLGCLMAGACEIHVLLNLTLLHLDLPPTPPVPELDIDGVQVSAELAQRLVVGRDATAAEMLRMLELFRSPDIYWGSAPWLLSMLRTAYGKFTNADVTASDHLTGMNTFLTIRAETMLLCSSPFQPLINRLSTPDWPIIKRHDLLEPMSNWDVFRNDEYCNSVPAWCTCSGHCSGICTLIVNELAMTISITKHFSTPYLFRMSFPRDSGGRGSQVFTTLRLVCATHWDAGTLTVVRDGQKPLNHSRIELTDILYGKERVVAVIHGGEILVHKLEALLTSYPDGDRWPFNLDARPLARKLVGQEVITVPSVVPLVLEPVDEFTEQVGKEITLSDSRLRYMMRQTAKKKNRGRPMAKPFRSQKPWSNAAIVPA